MRRTSSNQFWTRAVIHRTQVPVPNGALFIISYLFSPLMHFLRYSTGARACDTHIYKWTAYPFDLIAPITIIWKPLNSTAPSSPQPEPEPAPQTEASQPEAPATEEPSKTPSSSKKRPRKGTGKSNQAAPASIDLSENETRTVWVRAHPAVFEEVFSTLQTSASHNLEAARRADTNNQSKDIEVEIADLRGQVNVFEIVGPKSNQVIKGALDPIPQDERAGFRSVGSANIPNTCQCTNDISP